MKIELEQEQKNVLRRKESGKEKQKLKIFVILQEALQKTYAFC